MSVHSEEVPVMAAMIPSAGKLSRVRVAGLCSTALVALLLAPVAVRAQSARCDDPTMVPIPANCARPNSNVTVTMPAEPNTDLIGASPGGSFAETGFSISIENETVAGAAAPANPDRADDRAMARAAVDVTYDGLQVTPRLNVTTDDLRSSYVGGAPVTFRASTNYPAWISRAEVRIIDRADGRARVIDRLMINPNGTAAWTMPREGSGDYNYVLRVYDGAGRYNETGALTLARSDRNFATHETTDDPIVAAGEGDDRTAVVNIPVSGGAVTASGSGVAPGTTVRVMGETVPVDPSGSFVIQRILPTGGHVVDVAIDRNGRTIDRVARSIDIPASEWFYVAIGDLTLGNRLQAADPADEGPYAEGRAAYYLKGKVKGRTLITTSLDTGEGDLSDAFRRLDQKDPRNVLRRLDPDDYYPVYGDDSTAFDDTPTSGRFYARVERDRSYGVWGDFKAGIDGAELLKNDRELYGAQLHYETPGATASGEARGKVTVYAATPETLPQRDVLRGTGGATYFLSRQDINGGSETITAEVTDPVTGRVLSRKVLIAGQDYTLDALQGVIILTAPLSSSASGGTVIQNGASGGNAVNLIAQYEYTPTTGSLDGAALGGRVSVWANDRLRVGVTAMRETTGVADQTMTGADAEYRIGESSYLRAEVAQSEGPGFARSQSSDGGLSFGTGASSGAAGTRAGAFRIEGDFDLADLGSARDGNLGFYASRKDAGFSTLSEDIAADETLLGVYGRIEATDRVTLAFAAEDFERQGTESKTQATAEIGYKISDVWRIEGGVTVLDQFRTGTPAETGRRADVGLRLTYAPDEDNSVYVFGQGTVRKTGGLPDNNRIGIGGTARLSEKLTFAGEVSDGSGGIGGLARLGYAPSADTEVYVGYTLDPTRTGAGYALVGRDDGTVVLGGRHSQGSTVTTYAENKADLFGQRRSFTESYGVTYTPDDRWTLSGAVEMGEIRDPANGNFDRDAYSAGVAFTDGEGWKWRARLEYRSDDGAGLAQDRETWGVTGGFEYKTSEDWRVLGNLDALISSSDQSAFRDGEYVEASLGYAYRPVDNDRTNALFKLTYLRDLPGADQVSANGSANGPMQKSVILSADVNHDLNRHLTLGAKYGFRLSQVATRGTTAFTDNTAHLGILRADWHVVHLWDVLLEGRVLYTEETGTTDTGALAAVYRQIGNNAQVGVGYEWGAVSDDLSAIDYTSQGVFLNVIAKF
jgi:hypothetical protein